jgi:hypothetical protein
MVQGSASDSGMRARSPSQRPAPAFPAVLWVGYVSGDSTLARRVPSQVCWSPGATRDPVTRRAEPTQRETDTMEAPGVRYPGSGPLTISIVFRTARAARTRTKPGPSSIGEPAMVLAGRLRREIHADTAGNRLRELACRKILNAGERQRAGRSFQLAGGSGDWAGGAEGARRHIERSRDTNG